MGGENRVGQSGVVDRLRTYRSTAKASHVAWNSNEYVTLCVAYCRNFDNRAGGAGRYHRFSLVDFRMGSILVQATLARKIAISIRGVK